jgi:hypothetical protein
LKRAPGRVELFEDILAGSATHLQAREKKRQTERKKEKNEREREREREREL